MESTDERDKKSRRFILIILLLAFLACSFGFITYSRTFDYLDDKDESYAIYKGGVLSINPDTPKNGIVKATSSKGAVAEDATLTENGIIDINVHFSAPGQKAIYPFFGVNPTKNKSYLNSVIFGDKFCTPLGDTPVDVANKACDDIVMYISIKDDSYTVTNGLIDGHVLPAGSNEPIAVTIEYLPTAKIVPGGFKVDFGTSLLTYGEVD